MQKSQRKAKGEKASGKRSVVGVRKEVKKIKKKEKKKAGMMHLNIIQRTAVSQHVTFQTKNRHL